MSAANAKSSLNVNGAHEERKKRKKNLENRFCFYSLRRVVTEKRRAKANKGLATEER